MVTVALGLFMLQVSAVPLAAQPVCSAPEEASARVGELACIEGVVTDAVWAAQSRGRPTFLDFGPHFTIVIWQGDRAKFDPPPETLRGQRVRVQGRIETYRGKPQIVVSHPAQIESLGPVVTGRMGTATSTTPVPATALVPSPGAVPTPFDDAPATVATPWSRAAKTPTLAVALPNSSDGTARGVALADDDPVTGGTGIRWSLVVSGAGLIGAGATGALWHRLRQRP
jgi:hypothetical protein